LNYEEEMTKKIDRGDSYAYASATLNY
jgi:hypothetical protein